MPTTLAQLASRPLYRLLTRLRLRAEGKGHRRLLIYVDDAIDAVVHTAELEHRWTDHLLRTGQLRAHPHRAPPPSSEWMPTPLPNLAHARAAHQQQVRHLLRAIDRHPDRRSYRHALARWEFPARGLHVLPRVQPSDPAG